MPIVKLDKVTLAVDESGSGEPLILLHGFNADRHQFDILRPLFGARIRAIAPDQRDSPDSPFAEPYSMSDHAGDVAGLIGQLCGGPAHVVGTSYGGAIAMTLALEHPSAVKSLVLATTAAWAGGFKAPDVGSLSDQAPHVIERFVLEHFFTPYAIDHDPALMAAARAATRHRAEPSSERRRQALVEHDVRNRLTEIQAPTLILHGADDPIVPFASAQQLSATIPGADLRMVEGMRHAVSLEGRQEMANAVCDFIAQHPIRS